MLVLSRKPKESIIIKVPGLSTPIKFTIVGITGNKVRLGFEAPKEAVILREEVNDKSN